MNIQKNKNTRDIFINPSDHLLPVISSHHTESLEKNNNTN